MARSLLDRPASEVKRRVAWYIRRLNLANVSDEQLIAAAMRVEGTHHGVTLTKLRKAARRLRQGHQVASGHVHRVE